MAVIVILPAWTARAQDDDPRYARARSLYDEGAAHYTHHEYELAIDAFKSAYALSGKSNLLYNIALAYEEWSGHCADAREFYNRYLRLKPDASDRPDVEARLARTDQICPSVPIVSATNIVTAPPPAPHKPTRSRNAVALIVAGSGFVIAAGGGVTLAVAGAKYGEIRQTCPCPPAVWQPWQTATYVSYALIAAGGVALASGLLWFAAHPIVGANGGGVVVGGAF